MKIKRYVAANMRQALRDVRKEQGADAVILSNRRVEEGIEVVAAVDYDESLFTGSLDVARAATGEAGEPQPADTETGAANAEAESADTVGEAAASEALTRIREDVWARDAEIGEMRQEMRGLRELLEDQLSSLAWNEQARRNPATVCLLRHFAAMGLDPDIARSVASKAANTKGAADYIAAAGTALASALPLGNDEILEQGGIVAVVGPTGVGKTTSIAKIAARFALRHGRDSVTLISTDGFRIGAREQLATFARILDVPVRNVENRNELMRTVRNERERRLVLIDTAGVSQRDERLAQHLEALNLDKQPMRVYLALAANAQSQSLDEIVREFGRVTLAGCILTKVDEAGSLGGALAVLIRHGLPLAFIADGQRVPEDIHPAPARRDWLVACAMRLAGESSQGVSEEVMARHYGEVPTHAHA